MPIINPMKYCIRTCKHCRQNQTALIYGTCEECLIKSVRNKKFNERPQCRKRIIELLEEIPDLTLTKLAFWDNYETVPLIPSDGLCRQAKKMIQEEINRLNGKTKKEVSYKADFNEVFGLINKNKSNNSIGQRLKEVYSEEF